MIDAISASSESSRQTSFFGAAGVADEEAAEEEEKGTAAAGAGVAPFLLALFVGDAEGEGAGDGLEEEADAPPPCCREWVADMAPGGCVKE